MTERVKNLLWDKWDTCTLHWSITCKPNSFPAPPTLYPTFTPPGGVPDPKPDNVRISHKGHPWRALLAKEGDLSRVFCCERCVDPLGWAVRPSMLIVSLPGAVESGRWSGHTRFTTALPNLRLPNCKGNIWKLPDFGG